MLLSRIEFFIAIFLMASVSFPNVALANSANDVEGCKKGSYQLRDLELEFLHIANQDVTQIVQILSSLGYNTVSLDDKASASKRKVESYDCDELPVVMLPPALEEARLEFNADESSSSSSSSSSRSSRASSSNSSSSRSAPSDDSGLRAMRKPHSGETDQLLVFFHPSQQREYAELLNLVRNLDLEARQIYIEGLVLEVSEDALRESGIKFTNIKSGDDYIEFGALSASPVSAGGSKVLDLFRDREADEGFTASRLVQLQALVANGKAEVLSRPSVLALNNRQAIIQVVDIIQFPIAKATISSSGDVVQSAYTFEEIRPGITLNLRPRISADNRYVSMEIDVSVEAVVAANNGEVRNENGVVIATKPGASLRRVQTFARLTDRTPIIIGGLITSDKADIKNRVPILGDIPILGRLFGATQKASSKREVVIVLTPYVINEPGSSFDISAPNNTEMFDVNGLALFSDSYRLRSEDLYDFNFIYNRPSFQDREGWVQAYLKQYPDQRGEPIFRQFGNGNFPGGEYYVARMIYDLVKRHEIGNEVKASNLILSEKNQAGKTEVAVLDNVLARRRRSDADTVVISFEYEEDALLSNTPNVELVQLPKGANLNEFRTMRRGEPVEGKRKPVIVLKDKNDIERLKTAVVANAIINENGGVDNFRVGDFKRGKIIALPALDPNRFYMIDGQTAMIYAAIQDYVEDTENLLEYNYQQLEEVLSEGEGDGE
jgi:general secretion pathway protein D